MFQDFVKNLSILIHGTAEEKYNWIFDLYDLNGDGYITKEEMEDVVFSVSSTNMYIGLSKFKERK